MDSGRKSFRERTKAFLEHFYAALAAKAVISIGSSAVATAIALWVLQIIQEEWALATINAVLVIIYTVLLARHVGKSSDQITELLRYKSIGVSSGIEGFHPLETQEQKETGWKDCVEKIDSVHFTELSLALFTGASTFAFDDSKKAQEEGEKKHFSPLREALEHYQGNLRILLMRPNCPSWNECIDAFADGDEAARKTYETKLEVAYQQAWAFCDRLAKKHHTQLRSIEVRTYDRPPLYKMVIMGNYIWLQFYFPGKHVDSDPAYIVHRRIQGDGMAHSLLSIFDYRWKMGAAVIRRNEHGAYNIRELPPTTPQALVLAPSP